MVDAGEVLVFIVLDDGVGPWRPGWVAVDGPAFLLIRGEQDLNPRELYLICPSGLRRHQGDFVWPGMLQHVLDNDAPHAIN